MSPSAAWRIAEAADGIPRRINILADNVLIAGFGADQRPVGSQLAASTVREFEANSGGASAPRARRFGLRRRLPRPADTAPEPLAPLRYAGELPEPAADEDELLWRLAATEPAAPEPAQPTVVQGKFIDRRGPGQPARPPGPWRFLSRPAPARTGT